MDGLDQMLVKRQHVFQRELPNLLLNLFCYRRHIPSPYCFSPHACQISADQKIDALRLIAHVYKQLVNRYIENRKFASMTITKFSPPSRRVEIRTNRLVNDMMVGAYLSRSGARHGFRGVREYMPGDDVRTLIGTSPAAWASVRETVSRRARTGRHPGAGCFRVLRVRLHAVSKRESAVEIATTLACSAARSSDKVGLLLFTDQVELFLPRARADATFRTIKEMLFFRPKHSGTNIPAALAFLNHVRQAAFDSFLFTDFLHSFGADARSLQAGRDLVQEIGMTNARHDSSACICTTRANASCPAPGC